MSLGSFWRYWPVCAVLVCSAHAAEPGAPAGLAAERARISAERARVAERFTAENRACHQRFAVNDCLRANSVWRRGVLDELQRQEIAINDAERERKAQAQREALQDKQRAHEQQAQEAQQRSGAAPTAATPASRTPQPGQGPLPREAKPQADRQQQIEAHEDAMRRKQARHAADEARRAEQAARADDEAARRARRLQEAADYKAKVEARNAREPSKAQPLPVPTP